MNQKETKYKHINFIRGASARGAIAWRVRRDDTRGYILAPSRQYCDGVTRRSREASPVCSSTRDEAFREFISPPEGLWLCRNNRSGAVLAKLYYYPQWKQYVASFDEDAVFSADCLTDVADFMRQLNEAQIDET